MLPGSSRPNAKALNRHVASPGQVENSCDPSAWSMYADIAMRNLTLQMTDDLRRELDEISRRERRPTGDVAVSMLERSLRVNRFRGLRQRTLEALGSEAPRTDRDALDEIS